MEDEKLKVIYLEAGKRARTIEISDTLTAMQAELYDGDKVFAARAIAYATLLALVSVPVLSALL